LFSPWSRKLGREKAKVQQIRLWRETKEKSYPCEKTQKTGERGNVEKNVNVRI